MFGTLQTANSVVYFETLKRHTEIENSMDIQKEIENISSQIIAKYKPEKVILFGSAARGDTGPESDLDFLIIKKDTPHYGEDRIRELSRLIERNIPLIFLSIGPMSSTTPEDGGSLSQIILREGKVLYG